MNWIQRFLTAIATHKADPNAHHVPAAKPIPKTADETVNDSAVLQNDDHLFFAMAANEAYEVTMLLYITAASGTPDFKGAFSLPAGCTLYGCAIGEDTTGNFAYARLVAATEFALGSRAETHFIGVVKAIVVNGGNPGNFQFQWAQNTQHASDLTLKIYSNLIYHQLAP